MRSTHDCNAVHGINGGIQAEHTKDGGAHFTLGITDLGAARGFAVIASAFGIESSKENATGYEKVGKVDGRITTEEWDRQSRNGKFSWLVADRFVIDAEGSGGNIDDLKLAVASIKPGDIKALTGK
jgi:hypothetical protein